jgi:hypothetical protein
VPFQSGWRVVQTHAGRQPALGHRLDDRAAKAASLRGNDRRATSLNPIDFEPLASFGLGEPPRNDDAAVAIRECAIFARIGRQLVQRHADGLRCRRRNGDCVALEHDAGVRIPVNSIRHSGAIRSAVPVNPISRMRGREGTVGSRVVLSVRGVRQASL